MMPTPLQRLDRYYTHIPPAQIDAANNPGLLARIFGGTREPVIPYNLKNENPALRFDGYRAALAAIGLSDDDIDNHLKPGAANIYTEPKTDPEGRGYGRHLKWSAYVSPDSSHAVIEIASPYHIIGFCFARDGNSVVLDQIGVGDVDTHYTLDAVDGAAGAKNLRRVLLDVAAATIADLRNTPNGSETRFSALVKPVIAYVKTDMENRLSLLRSQKAVLDIRGNLAVLGTQFDAVQGQMQDLSENTLPAIQRSIDAVGGASRQLQDGMEKISGDMAANADAARRTARHLQKEDPKP